jgi:RsiW-degrading membrane proteinase PrsW (M82 family)
MPSASDDRAGRVATMLAGHWVYGALLGVLLAIGRRRQRVQQQVKRRFAV